MELTACFFSYKFGLFYRRSFWYFTQKLISQLTLLEFLKLRNVVEKNNLQDDWRIKEIFESFR